MKKIIITLLLSGLSFNAFSYELIHPLDFKGTDDEKAQVIEQIKSSVKEQYTSIGMGDASTLRLMEKQELDSFKKLTKAENRKLLDNVIEQYCSIGMCSYSTISLMYNQEKKASKEKLKW